MKLHEEIGRGCTILKVNREAFMPAMTQFFEVISLGMELGLKMKASGKSAAKPATEKKGSKKRTKGVRVADRHEKVIAVVTTYLKKNGTGTLKDLKLVAMKFLKDLGDPEQAVWKILQDEPTIQRVPNERGVYRLKGKSTTKAKPKKALNGHAKANGLAASATA
jgi:hypothetical protein